MAEDPEQDGRSRENDDGTTKTRRRSSAGDESDRERRPRRSARSSDDGKSRTRADRRRKRARREEVDGADPDTDATAGDEHEEPEADEEPEAEVHEDERDDDEPQADADDEPEADADEEPEADADEEPEADADEETEDDEDDGDERDRRSPRPRVSPARIIGAAREQVEALTGKRVTGVIGFDRTQDGWDVQVEVLELKRVPETMSILGLILVRLDDRGDLVGYRRLRRYAVSQVDED